MIHVTIFHDVLHNFCLRMPSLALRNKMKLSKREKSFRKHVKNVITIFMLRLTSMAAKSSILACFDK
jgi:hypothetical protein